MAETTGISWTRSTFNPWIGCTKVGPGCDHCYASVSTPARAMKIAWGPGQPRRHTSAITWHNPVKWNAEQERLVKGWQAGLELVGGDEAALVQRGFIKPEPWRVFCASLADVFDNDVDDAWRAELFDLIDRTPHLAWQLVTKRVGNVTKMVPWRWTVAWPANVWIIATVVNQEEFDRDWPKLKAVPSKVRGLSIEPMLGPINFSDDVQGNLHWAIYGGESEQAGAPARMCKLEWIYDGIAQCRRYGISPFVKQLGHNVEINGHALPDGVGGKGKRPDPKMWAHGLQVQEFPA